MSRYVLDQIYKLYVRPHLDYDDIIYHKHDRKFKLEFTKRLGLPSTLQHLLLVVHGEELTLISCTKNSAGKVFITGGGLDVSVTFISFELIRDLYTYTLR